MDTHNQSPTSIGVTARSYSDLVTIKTAADIMGLPYRQLLAATNEGVVPHYQIYRSRRLVRISEVMTAMQSIRQAVQHD